MFQFGFGTQMANALVKIGAASRLTDEEFIITEIRRFLESRRRMDMLTGERYYKGRHDILWAQRTMVGEGGKPVELRNLPNNKIVDNQYRKMVNQKTNYLLGQPVSIQTEHDPYAAALRGVLDKQFLRQLKNVGRDSLKCGIGWMFLHYDDRGELAFQRLKPWEVIPGWADEDHTKLDYAIRLYEVIEFEGKQEQVKKKVEVYHGGGIDRFSYENGKLTPEGREPYFTFDDTPYNWERIPLIPFKRDDDETPLIRQVKSLQDGINSILSTFENNMEEGPYNTILVLVNYGGEDLGEFKQNLAEVGIVKIETNGEANGDVKTLTVEVNAENYKAILEIFKKALIENAMGFDAKDDRLSGNPNQMNIQSMYSDIDLDANDMETEYQASFEMLLWFINLHLANTGQGDFDGVPVDVIFNRDMLMNEAEIIASIKDSTGILSDETLVAQHPWVDDAQKEMKRKKSEAEEAAKALDPYGGAFPNGHGGDMNAKQE